MFFVDLPTSNNQINAEINYNLFLCVCLYFSVASRIFIFSEYMDKFVIVFPLISIVTHQLLRTHACYSRGTVTSKSIPIFTTKHLIKNELEPSLLNFQDTC